MITTIAAVLGVSTVVGAAILRVSDLKSSCTLAAPLGFAALLTLAGLCIHLPGHADTCAAIIGIALLAALAYLSRAPGVPRVSTWVVTMVVAVVLLAMLPFAVAGRVGLLGVGTNDDMAEHLLAAWALQGHAPLASSKLISSGYPIGPHAIAAVTSIVARVSLEHAFTGLIVAVPALLALAAAASLGERSTWVRAVSGVLVGLCYLQAAFLVQASFKEPIEAVIVVAFAAALSMIERNQSQRTLRFLPLAVLAAGSVYVNSYLGVIWPMGTLLIWLIARLVLRRVALRGLVPEVRAASHAIAAAASLLVVLIAAEIPRMIEFVHSAYNHESSNVFGDLLQRLPPLEALGIWPRLDFRFNVPLVSVGGLLALVAFVVLIGALVRSVRRNDLTVPSALLASAVVFLATSTRSPYTAAKALVVAAPLATLLLIREGFALRPGSSRAARVSMLTAGVTGLLLAAAAYSSLEVLRDGPVGPSSHAVQLASFREMIGRQPTLFLGSDDYIQWELRGADIATPPEPLYTTSVVPLRRAKAQQASSDFSSSNAMTTTNRFAGLGLGFDFDSVPSSRLNQFAYVILPRSGYLNPPPSNWHRVATTVSYELWQRSGRTLPDQTLTSIDNPGAILNCQTPTGKAIAEMSGVAMTEPRPVIGASSEWKGRVGYAGQSAHQRLRLGDGVWLISLQYDSAIGVTVSASGLRTELPANLDPLGSYWSAGAAYVTHAGWVTVTVSYPRLSLIGRLLGAYGLTRAPAPTGLQPLGRITAARSTSADRLIPLRDACGRYVDWYRTSPAT